MLEGNKIENLDNVIKERHIDWGVTSTEVNAGDIPILDVGELITATDVDAALTEFITELNQFNDQLKNLTQVEIQQLETIGDVTLSYAQWGYLGELDQSLLTTGTPSFNTITINNTPTGSTDAATKGYVDSLIQGLDPQESVKDFWDASSNLPVGPSTGDRYICSVAGNGWTLDYVYEYNGATWDEIIPNEGYSTWVEDEDILYAYNGSDWVKIGSTITHNNLASVLGSTEGYHFSSSDYSNRLLKTDSVTDLSDVTSVGSGIIITGTERTNLGTAVTHYGITSGNPHVVTAAELTLGNVDNIADTNQILLGTVTTGDVVAIDSIGKVSSKANGDIFFWNTSLSRLGIASDNDILTLASGIPSWTTPTWYADADAVAAVEAAGLTMDAGKDIALSTTSTLTLPDTITWDSDGITGNMVLDGNGVDDVFNIQNEGSGVHTKFNFYNANPGPSSYRNIFQAMQSRGTLAIPTAIKNGDKIFSILAAGYGATGYKIPAGIEFEAIEDFTDSAAGGEIVFYLTPIGSATRLQVCTFRNTGLDFSSGKTLSFVDGGSVNKIQTSSDAFSNVDDEFMTAAAIDDQIDAKAYTLETHASTHANGGGDAVDHDTLTNFTSNEHFIQGDITTLGTVTSGDIDTIANYIAQRGIDDTPVENETDESITSNWAFDHEASPSDINHLTDTQVSALHTIYTLESHNNTYHSETYVTGAGAVSAVATADDYLKNDGDTITGNLILSESTGIGLDSALSATSTWSGNFLTITHSVAAGSCVHIDTDGTPILADADASTGMPTIGISCGSNRILTHGTFRTSSTSWNEGAPLYVSTTGTITETAPDGTGDQVQRIGIVLSTNTLLINISLDVLTV